MVDCHRAVSRGRKNFLDYEYTVCVIILPSGEGGVLLLAAAVSVIAAELRVGQGGNLLLKNLNLHGNKKLSIE